MKKTEKSKNNYRGSAYLGKVIDNFNGKYSNKTVAGNIIYMSLVEYENQDRKHIRLIATPSFMNVNENIAFINDGGYIYVNC